MMWSSDNLKNIFFSNPEKGISIFTEPNFKKKNQMLKYSFFNQIFNNLIFFRTFVQILVF